MNWVLNIAMLVNFGAVGLNIYNLIRLKKRTRQMMEELSNVRMHDDLLQRMAEDHHRREADIAFREAQLALKENRIRVAPQDLVEVLLSRDPVTRH